MKHPSRSLVLGASNSGKTTFLVDLLKNYLIKDFEQVIIFSPSFNEQETYDDIRDYVTKSYKTITKRRLKKLLKDLKKANYPQTLIIIDDQSHAHSVHGGQKGIFAELVDTARWINVSIIVCAHSLTSYSTALRGNLEHLFLFYQSNQNQRKQVHKEFMKMTSKQFKDLYTKYVINRNRGFIHFDLRPPVTIYPQCKIRKLK